MKKMGITNLPLHGGKAPFWLFQRMTKLAQEISILIIEEFGTKEFLKKLADPFWFQSLGCVLGFDWHSSGVTTTVCGAIKEGLKNVEKDLGIFIAGGKGNASRKTPDEIKFKSNKLSIIPEKLVYTSKIVAKIDNTAIQDGFQLYHHNFIFNNDGDWTVIQQGMNVNNKYARRYHWLSFDLKNFTEEPHKAICCDFKNNETLNMVAKESSNARLVTTEISKENPDKIIREFNKIQSLDLPRRHYVDIKDVDSKRLHKILLKTYEEKPTDFERLLSTEGLGPKTMRSLALISEIVYGSKPSYSDPARYSFAHGGKDGYPYPVDRKTYDTSIMLLRRMIYKMKTEKSEKEKALKRLFKFYSNI